jgi:DNA-binding transcriptional LysR family regulator
MSLNLNHLAIFRAVAETGSISKGAERLMVSQPAVSKQVGLFERSLGIALLERLPRGVRLTHAGEVLADYARRISFLEEQATQAMRELRGGSRGLVRVGASTTIAVYLLPQAIVAFGQSHPGVQVRLKVGRSDEIARQIQQGQLDVGYVEVRPDAEGLDVAVFRTDELVAIAAPRHPLARKRIVSPRQLIDEPFVVRDTGSDTKSFVERVLASRGLSVKPVMSVGSTEAVKTAVAAGIGIGIVSRLSTELEVKARRLAVLRINGLEIQRPLYRIMTTVKPNSAAIHAFCQILGPADNTGKA